MLLLENRYPNPKQKEKVQLFIHHGAVEWNFIDHEMPFGSMGAREA